MAIKIEVVGSYDDKAIKRAQRNLDDLGKAAGLNAKSFSDKFADMGRSMSDFGGTMTTHVTLPLLAAGAAVFAAFSEEEEAIARMTGALRANAGQANVTGDEIRNLASQLQKTTTFADDATISAAGLLLTFHNIRNELGDGNKVFDRTLVAAQNLSAALGTDLESATMQLAKALENPATGLTALSRSGTTFTAQQKDMIRTMVDAGDTLGAQRMILDVVESQYGGMAETMAQTTRGKIKQSLNTLGDSMEQFGALLVPMVDKVSEFIKQLGDGLANLEPETRQTIVMFAGIAAAIGPVLLVVGKLITSIVAIKGVLAGIVAAVSAPVLAVIAVIAALVAAFVVAWQNSEQFRITVTKAFNDVRDGVVEAWHGFIKPAIDQLVASLQEHVLPAVDRMAQTFAEAWPAISSAVTSAWGYIQPVLQALVSFIANYLIPALAFLAEVAVMTWTNIAQSAAGMWTHYVQPALSALRTGFDAVANFLSARVGDIVNVFSGVASAITGPFRTAFNFIADAWNSTIGGFGVDVPNIPGLPFGGQRIAFPTMPTFNKGGIVPGIPGDPQMAILHAGEMVLRRSEVDQYRRDRQNTSTTRGGDVYVTVNKAEASPYEIGRELLWAMKVAG
jgi:phage-related protein